MLWDITACSPKSAQKILKIRKEFAALLLASDTITQNLNRRFAQQSIERLRIHQVEDITGSLRLIP